MISKQDIRDYPKYNQIHSYFPDEGDLRRELYSKHMLFMKATKFYSEVMFTAGNKVGKTTTGGYLGSTVLTGKYPSWWEGRIFHNNEKGILMCAAGDSSKTTRDIIQRTLLGAPNDIGTGFIPKSDIVDVKRKTGIPDAYEIVYVKHVSGIPSELHLKSYDQDRKAFQGTNWDLVWADEQISEEIYTEMLLRIMTTNGLIIQTFTGLLGATPLVLQFCPDGMPFTGEVPSNPSRFIVNCTWDDVPHLTSEMKIKMEASIPPYMRDVRMKGGFQLGTGVIYPVSEDFIRVPDFDIPNHWKRLFSFDVGTDNNAVVWGAIDPATDTTYIYAEYFNNVPCLPIIHVENIKSKGLWIPGIIDTQAHASNPTDLKNLFTQYSDYGLNLVNANKGVQAGIDKTWEELSMGKLKVFNSCQNWFREFRNYRRNEKSIIVKKDDHCFTGDTKIITDKGLIEIKELVGKTGKILSLNGKYRSFNNCRLTRKNASIIELEFEDGFKVKCTPDHKFLTTEGFVKAIDLMDSNSYVIISKAIKGSLWKKLLFTLKLNKSFLGLCIISAVSIFKEVSMNLIKDSIEEFGNVLIKVKSLKDIMCTTLMETNQIITQKILSFFLKKNIYPITIMESQNLSHKMPLKPQPFGIEVLKASNGISTTTPNLNLNYIKIIKESAQIAINPVSLKEKNYKLFAQINASQLLEEKIKLIISLEDVSFVKKISLLINILRQKPVVEHAQVKVVASQYLKNEDVYCLDVPYNNLFALENGIMVHNCMDATRYLIMGKDNAMSEPISKPTRYYNPWISSDNFNNNSSWMRR